MILWLNPVGGIAGDMLLGALLGLGAPLEGVRAAIRSTELPDWRLSSAEVLRGGLTATRAQVVAAEDGVTERTAAELLRIVGRARPIEVAALAGRAVRALAEVEAALHATSPDRVHLHELGGLDTVVDTVGVAAALHLLEVTEVHCAPLPLGTGTVHAAHGQLPLPAPATAALLARMGAPVLAAGVAGETITPTGAALLLAAGARFGPVPPMTVRAVGYGAGGRDVPDRPNVVQALLGAPAEPEPPASAEPEPELPGEVTAMVQVETNVDDVTGELLANLVELLLAEGAADAWVTPVVMKKGRPAHTVHVLAHPERAAACERLLLRETGSLGLRRHQVQRLALPRRTGTVQLGGRSIRIKYGPWGAKPEYDDVRAAARALGLPHRQVAERARSLGDDLDHG